MLPMLEGVLSSGILQSDSLDSFPPNKIIRNIAAANRQKEGAVVALGSVALLLKGGENEEKIENTINAVWWNVLNWWEMLCGMSVLVSEK